MSYTTSLVNQVVDTNSYINNILLRANIFYRYVFFPFYVSCIQTLPDVAKLQLICFHCLSSRNLILQGFQNHL